MSEAELWVQYTATRDPQVREALVMRYVPLVHFVLNRLGLTPALGPNYEDLASQGLLGLIEAVDRYDAGYGTQFSTYAATRVRGRVLDQLRSQDFLSRSARRRARRLQAALTSLWSQLHRAPTDEELAEHLGLSQAQLRQSLADGDRVLLSLDSIAGGDEEEGTMYELVADDHEDNADPAEVLAEVELKERLVQALHHLPEREQLVLSLYYYEDLTLKEIGAVLDLSESRVCQLHARAVLSLRGLLARDEEPQAAARPAAGRARPPERATRLAAALPSVPRPRVAG